MEGPSSPREEAVPSPPQDAGGIVRLNVGGHKFVTTLSTLRGSTDSMLSQMFSAHGIQPSLLDPEGNFFIDRDGQLFSYILSHLRSPGSGRLPSTLEELRELQQEANFFGLKDLEERVLCAMKEEERRSRCVVFELSAWGVPTKCGKRCNCWQLTATSEWDGFDFHWHTHDHLQGSLPGNLQFRQTPNLTVEVALDPSADKETKAKQIRDVEWKLVGSLSPPPIVLGPDDYIPYQERIHLGAFLEGAVESAVTWKERIYGAFMYYPNNLEVFDWDDMDDVDDDRVHEESPRHYAMWVRLTLRRK